MIAALIAVLLQADCPATSLEPGMHHFTFTHANHMREYDVLVPKASVPKGGFPMVVGLHGAMSNPQEFNATTRLSDLAGRDPFVLVLPAGLAREDGVRSWNAGACCGEAKRVGVDDTAFIREMIDRVVGQVCVDSSRVFAVGHSNGGSFAHRLACEMSDRLAAVASVNGVILDRDANETKSSKVFDCKPTRRIPVLQIHGSADTCSPEKGGLTSSIDGTIRRRALAEVMDDWRDHNGCGKRMRVLRKVGSTICRVFDGCPDHADVEVCRVEGSGHGWPGAAGDSMKATCGGQQVSDFNASELIWGFFLDHPLPGAAPVNVALPPTDLDVILRGASGPKN